MALAAARPLDLLEALDDAGEVRAAWRKAEFRAMADQIEQGTAISVRAPDGALVLLAGLLPNEPDEAWAWIAPGPALARCRLGALRGALRVLEYACREIAPVTVKTFTAGSVAGDRLARLFGFTATGLLPSPHGPITVWTRRF